MPLYIFYMVKTKKKNHYHPCSQNHYATVIWPFWAYTESLTICLHTVFHTTSASFIAQDEPILMLNLSCSALKFRVRSIRPLSGPLPVAYSLMEKVPEQCSRQLDSVSAFLTSCAIPAGNFNLCTGGKRMGQLARGLHRYLLTRGMGRLKDVLKGACSRRYRLFYPFSKALQLFPHHPLSSAPLSVLFLLCH